MPDDKLPDIRLSNRDRDAAVQRLQTAFLEGRLTDVELAERIDHALSSRVQSDLAPLLGDLPMVVETGSTPAPLRLLSTYKARSVQQGRWTVPPQFKSSTYKSTQIIDLTKAVLTAEKTEILVKAYKSDVTIVVPHEARVELSGHGYKSEWSDETLGEGGVPVIVIKGSAYKSRVVVRRGT